MGETSNSSCINEALGSRHTVDRSFVSGRMLVGQPVYAYNIGHFLLKFERF